MTLKRLLLGLLKAVLLVVAMFLSFAVAGAIAGAGGTSQAPEAASRQALAAIGVSLINALVLAYPIARSRWHGLKLMGAVVLLEFGVETFMSQIETLFFGSAFNIPSDAMVTIILSGALRALIFAPLAVLILGKMRSHAEQGGPNTRLKMPWRSWAWRLALLPVIYLGLYFVFGYYVAWQSPDVRQLYAGTTAIEPFLQHMAGVVQGNPWIFPFQLLRGLMWIGLALPVVRMMKGRAWETALAVGLALGLLLTSQLLIPNPYMPAPVRLAHFLETSSSNFIYGALIGWLFCAPRPASGQMAPAT
jgi:hypothetical protein